MLCPTSYTPPNCGSTTMGTPLWELQLLVAEVLWWTALGIASSIGFGTGLHSGIMFLFPHVMKVVFASEGCNLGDMRTQYLHPCKFECAAPSSGRFFSTFQQRLFGVRGASGTGRVHDSYCVWVVGF